MFHDNFSAFILSKTDFFLVVLICFDWLFWYVLIPEYSHVVSLRSPATTRTKSHAGGGANLQPSVALRFLFVLPKCCMSIYCQHWPPKKMQLYACKPCAAHHSAWSDWDFPLLLCSWHLCINQISLNSPRCQLHPYYTFRIYSCFIYPLGWRKSESPLDGLSHDGVPLFTVFHRYLILYLSHRIQSYGIYANMTGVYWW